MSEKWTDSDAPAQHGRVAVITGANTGIGFEVAKRLAERGASVVLAVRNPDKGKKAADVISGIVPEASVTIEQLDLASLDSIRHAAKRLRERLSRIDLLINNAGVLFPPKRTSTAEGFELQFGVNYLGHFAFTGLLLDAMLPLAGSRIVTVSSLGHRLCRGIDFADLQWEHSYDRVAAYAQSKLAVLMFTYELNRRLTASRANTTAVASHPGAVRTNILRHAPALYRALGIVALPFSAIVAQSASMGSLPILRAATAATVHGGQYYGPCGRWPRECKGHPILVESSAESHDTNAQRRLWAISENLTGVNFPVQPTRSVEGGP